MQKELNYKKKKKNNLLVERKLQADVSTEVTHVTLYSLNAECIFEFFSKCVKT